MNKFIPKEYKYYKIRKKLKFFKKKEVKHINLKTGNIGLKALESGQISSDLLELIRLYINRKIKKTGNMVIYIQTNIPITKKSTGIRMGKGAGTLNKWISPVKKGKIIIELNNVPNSLGYITLKSVAHKLPIKSKIIFK